MLHPTAERQVARMERPDRFAAYRQGRVPPEQRVRLGVGLARLRRRAWLGAALVAACGLLLLWFALREVQFTFEGAREPALVSLALLAIGALFGLCWATWYLVRLRAWRRELAAGTMAQAEGAIA